VNSELCVASITRQHAISAGATIKLKCHSIFTKKRWARKRRHASRLIRIELKGLID
jgi:hypothetical protein